MRQLVKCLKADFYRAFVNSKFLLAVVIISIIPCLAMAEDVGYNLNHMLVDKSIYNINDLAFSFSEIGVLFFVFTAYVYADCFCDDLSSNYHIYSISRGNITAYTCSKIMTVFLSSFVVNIVGMLLFALASQIFLGMQWVVPGEEATNFYLYRSMSIPIVYNMIENENYWLVYIFFIIIQSMLYIITSLASLLFSLYIRNKLLILSIPIIIASLVNFIISYIVPNYPGYKEIFSVWFLMDGELINKILFLIGTVLGLSLILSILVMIKVRRCIIE